MDVGFERHGEQCENDEECDQRHLSQAREDLLLFAGFSLKLPRQAGVFLDLATQKARACFFASHFSQFCFEATQRAAFENLLSIGEVFADQLKVGDVGVRVGHDVEHPLAIFAENCGKALSDLEVRDFVKRHLLAVRCADAQLLQILDGGALVFRVADHYFDVIAASLDALHLHSVECRTNLTSEVCHA